MAASKRKINIQQKWQWLRRRYFWRMDIHASAWIATCAWLDRTNPGGVHIAENCFVGHEAVVLAHDLTRGLHVDTWIGPDSYVGARAIILPGVRVGANCHVEPGSVVVRDVPDGMRVIGNPAQTVGSSQGDD